MRRAHSHGGDSFAVPAPRPRGSQQQCDGELQCHPGGDGAWHHAHLPGLQRNAIGLSYSREGRFDYFPIDERHPAYTEEPYGLSKWICEQQADSFARRIDGLVVASMRFHWVVPDRATAGAAYNTPDRDVAKHLWGYTLQRPAARACLMSLVADFTGHEVFYIAAPDTTNDDPSLELAERYYPDVPIRGDLSGNKSFFDSSKAGRLLGWRHDLPEGTGRT